jgi:hypothetical protein
MPAATKKSETISKVPRHKVTICRTTLLSVHLRDYQRNLGAISIPTKGSLFGPNLQHIQKRFLSTREMNRITTPAGTWPATAPTHGSHRQLAKFRILRRRSTLPEKFVPSSHVTVALNLDEGDYAARELQSNRSTTSLSYR